ncbi:glycosyltransferase family 61 protein [filamentous cyanobacterium CCP2]|nr:glycosyltransferase family 61 protein [filamentous cyanobacterium CCP2]
MLNYFLFKQKFYRLFGRRRSFQDVSDRSWILHPEEKRSYPSAIYLNDDLEKVRGVHFFSSYEHEVSHVQPGVQVDAATVLYRVKNARLIRGHIYKEACHYPLVETPHQLWISERAEHFPKAALACSWVGNKWFGDWMVCDVPLALAAQKLAEPITVDRPLYRDEPGYRQLFHLPRVPVSYAHCDELLIIDDRGQNHYMRKRYQALRSLLKSSYPASKNSKVMLRRGTDGSVRLIKNATEVEAFLRRQGFVILEPASMTPEEIVQQTLGAQIILGVEGSHMSHGIYTIADGGTLLTFQPPWRFNTVFKSFTDCVDLKFAFLVGDEVEGGFVINIERLSRLLEKIAAVVRV